ncbi:MAG TPA: CehA/McbA family metallohydrolase [Planctomycetaceae bacterium]|nr:CehA/McbA family metallohydrolase [Planctomycetaceae bacterium]
MRAMALAATTVGLLLAALMLGAALQQTPTQQVELTVLTDDNWEQTIPAGKEVDAILGDFVLRNAHLTAVIAQPLATRNANMTTKEVGGCLIDLTTNVPQSDQLNAFFPGKKLGAYRQTEFAVTPKGGTESAVAQLPTKGATGDAAAVIVKADGNDMRPEIVTRYRLGVNDDALTVETTYHNVGKESIAVSLEDDFRADGGKEDMVRSPNGTADRFWLHDQYWGQAYGLDADGRTLQLNSDARTTQIKYVDGMGESKVTLEPGKSVTLTRRVYPGRHAWDVHAMAAKMQGRSTTLAKFRVRDGNGRPAGHVRFELARGESRWGTATTDKDGLLESRILEGKYELLPSALGVPLSDGLFIDVHGPEMKFEVLVQSLQLGRVVAAITDGQANPIPCKLEFQPLGETPKPNFGPETAEFAVRNLCYAPLGKVEQALPPGKYNVVISHGPEYDIAEQEITIAPFTDTPLIAKLNRSVNTKGWVSSDFHSHSSPSGDNTSSQLGRVLNLVCEHLEFAPCTKHNRISTYLPHIERLGIAKHISTVSGMELTGSPLPLNHQNVFPMKHKPRTQDGGGPVTADSLEEQIERIALWDDRSEKLLQVNHPDLGWMFYDKNGDGQPDAGHERAFPFMDVMEIHPVDHALDLTPYVKYPDGKGFHNTVFRWLQLLNQGYRIYGVVNTDSHYNLHGSGWLRNWIQSPTDEPSEIKYMDMVHAAEQGRLVMSNGPFLEVLATEQLKSERVTAGQDLVATSKNITLMVRVECPNWMDVDRVSVLVNGRIDPKHHYTRMSNPDVFCSGPVKFDRMLEVTLPGDAHVIVVTGDAGGNLSRVYGDQGKTMQPAAVSNPIFVDTDGNGFRPNKDTLDAPLPVKFVERK